ncbi:MAG: hypothetical protein ACRDZR_16130 [Acidimicrobiales bacterium]
MDLVIVSVCGVVLTAVIAAVAGTFGLMRWLVGRLDRQFEKVDQRFDTVDRRFEHMDERFEGVDRRLDHVTGEIVGLRADLADHRAHHAA